MSDDLHKTSLNIWTGPNYQLYLSPTRDALHREHVANIEGMWADMQEMKAKIESLEAEVEALKARLGDE
jgi:hypothetical protein